MITYEEVLWRMGCKPEIMLTVKHGKWNYIDHIKRKSKYRILQNIVWGKVDGRQGPARRRVSSRKCNIYWTSYNNIIGYGNRRRRYLGQEINVHKCWDRNEYPNPTTMSECQKSFPLINYTTSVGNIFDCAALKLYEVSSNSSSDSLGHENFCVDAHFCHFRCFPSIVLFQCHIMSPLLLPEEWAENLLKQ